MLFLLVLVVVIGFIFWMLKKDGGGPSPTVHNSQNINLSIVEQPDKEIKSWEMQNFKRVSAHIKITYLDGDKNKSTRKVKVSSLGNKGSTYYIYGYCEKRGDSRTFRADRIKSCIDIESGEIVSDVVSYLEVKYENSPQIVLDKLTEEYNDTLLALYYVAKADGQYRAAEKEVILSYLKELARDERITPEIVSEAMKEIGSPTISDFKATIIRILNGGRINPHKLLECCTAIVNTQTTIHPEEKKALYFLQFEICKMD